MLTDNGESSIANQARADYAGKMEARLDRLEGRLTAIEADVAVIRSNYATKEDLAKLRDELRGEIFSGKSDVQKAINEQTWKILHFMTGVVVAVVGAVYFIARYVH
jgi:BMFP domain-containing protein YqiC